ncbi:MAG: hypothetical protein IPM45_06125 [Acidimicrobiales bacterium]|nr:hypothetical protein [Acidimicrobiales bacterium]
MTAALERALADLSASQHGLFHREQALSVGFTSRMVTYRLAERSWNEIDLLVYRRAGTPAPPEQPAMAAVLASGGVASHRTAAALHGLLDRVTSRPEVLVPPGRSYRSPLGLGHRTAHLPPEHVTTVAGMPTTTVLRTLTDLGRVVTTAQLERAVERALCDDAVTIDELTAAATADARGRPGVARLRRVLGLRGPGAPPTESELETRFLQLLRRAGLPEPVRQHEVVLGGRRLRLDFSYPGWRIALEVLGRRFHQGGRAFEVDPARRNLLNLHDWLVLEFTWHRIHLEPDEVIAELWRAVAARTRRGA